MATPETVNSGSNAVALAPLLGVQNPAGMLSTSVYVNGVAKVHVGALDPNIKGNWNFGTNSNVLQDIKWDDAIETVKRRFPNEAGHGFFPLEGLRRPNW